jgi:hypothetical protein
MAIKDRLKIYKQVRPGKVVIESIDPKTLAGQSQQSNWLYDFISFQGMEAQSTHLSRWNNGSRSMPGARTTNT